MAEFFQKATWSVEIIVFLAVMTIASYLLVRKKSGQDLTPVYLLSITVKLILSGIFVIIFVVSDKPAANYNVVVFLIGYVIFTAAEVIFLLLKKKT